METADDARTKYGQAKPYNQQSVIGLLMSVLGWNGSSKTRAKQKEYETWWADHRKKSKYEQKLINMVSSHVFERIMTFDREQKKTGHEIAVEINCGAKMKANASCNLEIWRLSLAD